MYFFTYQIIYIYNMCVYIYIYIFIYIILIILEASTCIYKEGVLSKRFLSEEVLSKGALSGGFFSWIHHRYMLCTIQLSPVMNTWHLRQ